MMKDTFNNSYKNCYLLYARKSTDDNENQKNSLAYQISEGVKYAHSNHLRIAQVDIPGFCSLGQIKERHTGFKEDEDFAIDENGTVTYKIERPKFFQLVKYLKQSAFKGVIFLCWDRASRNKNDDSLLRKLMGHSDIRFVQTSYDTGSSSGQLHMDIDGTFAQHYSRVISEKIRNQNRKLREEGVCLYKAPVGYLNTGDSRNKPFDPARAPIVKSLFEKYAEGTWTLRELSEWARKQGLTMPATRRKRTAEEMLSDEDVIIEPTCQPITYKNIHRILSHPFYIGKMRDRQGNLRESVSHKPLITSELFYRVQDVLKSKKVSIHYVEKPYFPYRGMIRCANCGRVYTPYEQKGIHYYGARCDKSCSNTKRSINASFIENSIGTILSQLSYSDEELSKIDVLLKGDLRKLEEKRRKALDENERQKKKIRDDLAYLRENKLTLLKTSVFSPDEFISEEMRLNSELEKLSEQETASDVAMHQVVKDLVLLSELVKSACAFYFIADSEEKKILIQKVFSELKLSGNTLTFKTNKGFKLLEHHPVSLGAGCVWISELLKDYPLIKSSIDELKNLSFMKQ